MYQACYEEIDALTIPLAPQPAELPTTTATGNVYIVTGFRTLESNYNKMFEENWIDLTGARSIYLNLSAEFGLSRVSLLRRLAAKDVNMYSYILFVILTTVGKHNRLKLMDFVHRLRLRMLGYLAVYEEQATHSVT